VRNVKDVQPTQTNQRLNLVTGFVSNSNAVNYVLHTARDEAESTVPVNGKWVKPTQYYGWYFMGSTYPYDYTRIATNGAWEKLTGVGVLSLLTQGPPYRHQAELNGLPKANSESGSIVDAKLRSRVTDEIWNAGQSLGEMRETLSSIVGLVQVVVDLIRFLKRPRPIDFYGWTVRNRRQRKRLKRKAYQNALRGARQTRRGPTRAHLIREAARGLAHGWLAYKFFWLPVLSDIHSAIAALSAQLKQPGIFRVTADYKRSLPPLPLPGLTGKVMETETFTGREECKGELSFSINSGFLATLSAYGLTDPLALAWELLPMSFVIDWFIPVGSFVRALQRPIGLSFYGGYRTTYLEWQGDYRFRLPGESRYLGGIAPHATGFHKSFRRDKYTGFPVPVPHFRGFGDLGLDRLISIMALLLR